MATLHYFPFYAKGEFIRWVLEHAGVAYTDRFIDFSEWGAIKESDFTEFNYLPVLEVDGHNLSQTQNIVRYLARTHNLYSDDPREAWLIDTTLDGISERHEKIVGTFLPAPDTEALNAEVNGPYLTLMKTFEKRIIANSNGTGWLVGNRITVADIVLAVAVHDIFLKAGKEAFKPALTDACPSLKGHARRVLESSEGLRNYIAGRPDRPV